MVWWMVCFAATIVTLVAKFYFTRAAGQLRQNLVRKQREALEMKGKLTDARQQHQQSVRHAKEKAASIKRLTSRIQELEDRAKQVESQPPEDPLRRP